MPPIQPTIEPLDLSANQWRFLSKPDNYVKASQGQNRPLDPKSTPRQFKTARDILDRLNGSYGKPMRRGILLADDVGLGKTTVAALVAWVISSVGNKVRIYVPNDVMRRRWVDELKSHVPLLKKCAPELRADENRVKDGKGSNLKADSINVVNHSYVEAKPNRRFDLLIIDEAHRAKGKDSTFSKELERQKKNAKRILILTATPFSIQLNELTRMLSLISADKFTEKAVSAYSKALTALYSDKATRRPDKVAEDLAKKATAAVDALRDCVIRHAVDDIPNEKEAFGDRADWPIKVESANPSELELMLRMDRAQRVAKRSGAAVKAMHDPRFDVGWQHLDNERAELKKAAASFAEPVNQVVNQHLKAITALRAKTAVHPKMAAVAEAVKSKVAKGEKVLLFCHHHATAQELTIHLDSVLSRSTTTVKLRRET